jgi:hypothetical protein
MEEEMQVSNFVRLSALAFAAAALLAAPSQAISINLGGGGPLVEVGHSGSSATVSAGGVRASIGGDIAAGTDVSGGGSTASANAILDLFGAGDASAKVSGALLGDGTDVDLLLNLFGPAAGGGGSGGGVGGGGGNGGGTLVASLGIDGLSCFTPSDQQIATLLSRHSDGITGASSTGISNVKVIEVELCPAARLKLQQIAEANSSLQMLQTYAARQLPIQMGLARSGHTMRDVIAVDRQGNTLVVYVI